MKLNLASWRRARGITQAEMARRCDVSVMTIRTWEQKPERIMVMHVPVIAKALDVAPDEIIFLPDKDN